MEVLEAKRMVKRVIYSVSGLQEWIGLAKRFQSSHGWQPCYWIAPRQIEAQVRESFSTAIIHAFLDAAVGIPPHELEMLRFRTLDAEDLSRFSQYETTALRIMDRMDSGDSFSYEERRRFFLQQVMYWSNVVEYFEPDLVFFTESPHSVAQFVLYAVCVERRIPIVMFATTSLPSRVYVRAKIEDPPRSLNELCAGSQNALEQEAPSLAPDIMEHVRCIKGNYSEGEPWYMRRQREIQQATNYTSRLRKLILIHRWPRYAANRVLRLLHLRIVQRNSLKLPGKSLEDSAFSLWQWTAYRYHASSFKRRLKARYTELSSASSVSEKYIYVPLHYQPERTSDPEGGAFGDQWLLVNFLVQAVPSDWFIYVREHSSQFHSRLYGHQGRTRDYYEQILALGKVRLIPLDESSFQLIDGSEAVATLTGTAGWEAILRGTPVLVFGSAWYRDCEGAFEIRTIQDLRDAIAKIQKGNPLDGLKVTAYLEAIAKQTVRAYLNPSVSRGSSLSTDENLSSLIEALDMYVTETGLVK